MSHRGPLLRWTVLAVALCSAVAAQSSLPRASAAWIVDNQAGPGHDFTDLAVACESTPEGATILVMDSPQPYQLPRHMTEGKRILGISGKPVLAAARGQDPRVQMAAGEMLVMSNLRFHSDQLPMVFLNNAGRVILHDLHCVLRSTSGMGPTSGPTVIIADSLIEAPWSALGCESTLLLQNCTTRCSRSRTTGTEYPAIWARNGGQITIVGGHHSAGEGFWYCDPWTGWFAYDPAPACNLTGGGGTVAGPAIIEAGWMPQNPCGPGGNYRGTFDITLACFPGRSDFYYDPMMQGRFDDWCLPAGTIHRLEMPAILPGPAVRAQVQDLAVYGPTSSVVAVFASFAHANEPIELPIGEVWLDPDFVVCVGAGAVDAQRSLTMQTRIPDWLSIGDVLVYQAVSMTAPNLVQISPPGFSVVH